MARLPAPGEKTLFWMGSSREDLMRFPPEVRSEIGEALGTAQFGGKAESAKPWKGERSGVFEIVESYAGNAYRAVYTVRFRQAVYVLHAFQKKSTHGIKTSMRDVDLIHERLRAAQGHYEEIYGVDKG